MASHVVARVDEIPPGSRKLVEIAGRSIGVFNIDGRFYALRNRCPHQGGPLCEGLIVGALRSDGPGRYDHRPEDALVRCPWHGWEFDVRTGQSWFDPDRTRVRRYEVDVREAGEQAPEPEPGELVRGPHVAERYDVSVRDACVVVEVGNRQR